MSKYPGNPLWCHEHDQPLTIFSRTEWDKGAQDGHITPEHVMARMLNIAEFAFSDGNDSSIAYDADGFVIALIAAGMALSSGVSLHVYPNDHPPPHVHIKVRSQPDSKIRIRLDTGEYMDAAPRGLTRKKLEGIRRAVLENHRILAGWWQTYHGKPVALGDA